MSQREPSQNPPMILYQSYSKADYRYEPTFAAGNCNMAV